MRADMGMTADQRAQLLTDDRTLGHRIAEAIRAAEAVAAERGRRIVIVVEQGEGGLFYATSDDIPGLFMAEKNVGEIRRKAPAVIEELARAAKQERGGEVG